MLFKRLLVLDGLRKLLLLFVLKQHNCERDYKVSLITTGRNISIMFKVSSFSLPSGNNHSFLFLYTLHSSYIYSEQLCVLFIYVFTIKIAVVFVLLHWIVFLVESCGWNISRPLICCHFSLASLFTSVYALCILFE